MASAQDTHYKRMEASWRALAAERDWLDGQVPLSALRPMVQSHSATVAGPLRGGETSRPGRLQSSMRSRARAVPITRLPKHKLTNEVFAGTLREVRVMRSCRDLPVGSHAARLAVARPQPGLGGDLAGAAN